MECRCFHIGGAQLLGSKNKGTLDGLEKGKGTRWGGSDDCGEWEWVDGREVWVDRADELGIADRLRVRTVGCDKDIQRHVGVTRTIYTKSAAFS